MQEDFIIQQNLFVINNETNPKISNKEIIEDLSTEKLKKESKKRPRQRKNTINLINKTKDDSNKESKYYYINEKSYSYKTVAKEKLTPVMKHYVNLKEENKDR